MSTTTTTTSSTVAVSNTGNALEERTKEGMSTTADPDLDAPWSPDTLIQVRTSKMQRMRGLSVETGIYKEPKTERIFCGPTGLESDEHDLTFHGGVDKAVHQYYPGHYSHWRKEFPTNNGEFTLGGFGENLVAAGNMNERNICIGDTISIGPSGSSREEDGVIFQVSLPRQPCFKLNHRFGLKNFAPNTWKLSRTGWYYRVIKTGYIGAGDTITLVERPHPQWTIERIQEYLHRNKTDLAKLTELLAIPEFGKECQRAFKGSIEAIHTKAEANIPETFTPWTVIERKTQTPRITSFTLQRNGTDDEGEEIDPGSYTRLRLGNGLTRSYSIVHGASNRLTLGIALDEHSRGGSRYLHEQVMQGNEILVGKIKESVPFPEQVSNHIFLAGGIGITAFLPHCAIMKAINLNFTLHVAVRSPSEVPFSDALAALGSRVVIYHGSRGERMDIPHLLRTRGWNAQVYACGPERMVEAVRAEEEALGIEEGEVHYEAFASVVGGDKFSVSVKGEGGRENERVVQVGEKESLMQALRREGWDVDSSCEVGNCGTCRVQVCEGKEVVEHRGSGLSKKEKEDGVLLSCVSRAKAGGHLVIEF